MHLDDSKAISLAQEPSMDTRSLICIVSLSPCSLCTTSLRNLVNILKIFQDSMRYFMVLQNDLMMMTFTILDYVNENNY